MALDIPPLKEADLPERKLAFWKMTGPGAILVGLSIGAGELIIWPWIMARFGPGMIWAAALGVFIQLWVNFEIGRWAIATGEGPFTAMTRLWRGFIPLFLLLSLALTFLPGWARGSGVALKNLLFGVDGPGPDWVWTAVTFVGIALVLLGPKRIYAAVERTVMILVSLIVVGLLVVMFKVGNAEVFQDFGRGLINVGHIELADDFPFRSFFSAVVFAGAGGFGNLYYAYYLRDKQIGMGARIPLLLNPLRNQQESLTGTGYIFPDTEDNRRRFRDWFNFVKLDQTMYFWFLNTVTMFLFMFGALAVLWPAGIVPGQSTLVWDLAMILEGVMGTPGRYLFLLIGMAALFSTQLTIVDGTGRIVADMLHTNFASARKIAQEKMYLWIVIGVMVLGVFATFLFENVIGGLNVILLNALLSGFAMAVYVPAILWANLKFLPKSARPNIVYTGFTGIAALVYVAFAVHVLWVMVSGLFTS